MTEEEMIAKGMSINRDGFWIGSKMKGYKENETAETTSNENRAATFS